MWARFQLILQETYANWIFVNITQSLKDVKLKIIVQQ